MAFGIPNSAYMHGLSGNVYAAPKCNPNAQQMMLRAAKFRLPDWYTINIVCHHLWREVIQLGSLRE